MSFYALSTLGTNFLLKNRGMCFKVQKRDEQLQVPFEVTDKETQNTFELLEVIEKPQDK